MVAFLLCSWASLWSCWSDVSPHLAWSALFAEGAPRSRRNILHKFPWVSHGPVRLKRDCAEGGQQKLTKKFCRCWLPPWLLCCSRGEKVDYIRRSKALDVKLAPPFKSWPLHATPAQNLNKLAPFSYHVCGGRVPHPVSTFYSRGG